MKHILEESKTIEEDGVHQNGVPSSLGAFKEVRRAGFPNKEDRQPCHEQHTEVQQIPESGCGCGEASPVADSVGFDGDASLEGESSCAKGEKVFPLHCSNNELEFEKVWD
ncbi:hypothetical protein, partial [Enterobacter cloacae complex sp. CH23B]|uniref:hypothetical protein n=1 Tax=Enterobacter cloacae complex sp. CH23B TaxID=2511986 RepID=UPI001026AC30